MPFTDIAPIRVPAGSEAGPACDNGQGRGGGMAAAWRQGSGDSKMGPKRVTAGRTDEHLIKPRPRHATPRQGPNLDRPFVSGNARDDYRRRKFRNESLLWLCEARRAGPCVCGCVCVRVCRKEVFCCGILAAERKLIRSGPAENEDGRPTPGHSPHLTVSAAAKSCKTKKCVLFLILPAIPMRAAQWRRSIWRVLFRF